MNKAELIAVVSEKVGASKKETEDIVNTLLAEVETALIKGEEVKISGFGGFVKKERKAREGSNPTTHEKITIAASKTVAFKPSKALKEKL
jgi:nucleoid DNA-binding protein